jgi:molybdenum cofactor biosynthesis protein MoaC
MGMFDVAHKPDTLRQAWAQAIVNVSAETITLIKAGKSPKGDIVESARFAGTMAAKRTSDIIPYCHPIPIDYIRIDVDLKETSIEVSTEVKTVWKTGVEMEALTAASVAALTIYDMLKPIDETLSIGSVRLLKKSGGVKSFQEKYSRSLKAAVVFVSGSALMGELEDKSGKIIVKKLEQNGFEVDMPKVILNDTKLIQMELKRFCDEVKIDLVVTCGGTGLGTHDIIAESTLKVVEKELSGVSELLRAYGQRRTPLSMLSRGVCGIRRKTVIVNLAGDTKSIEESLNALFPGITNIYKMLES